MKSANRTILVAGMDSISAVLSGRGASILEI